MNSIAAFATKPFITALKGFFEELNVPVNYLVDEPASISQILGSHYKPTHEAHKLIQDVYVLGVVDDAIIKEGKNSFTDTNSIKKLSTDYDGILICGVILKPRPNNLLHSRSQLAEITRAFNREFKHTPVTIVFKYNKSISFSNSERIKYTQEWREGEKVGKVTMLKDVSIEKTLPAHEKILWGLKRNEQQINSFKKLYKYWQTVFSLQALNDQFYADLQEWFYYASQNTTLPEKPSYITEKENIKNFLVRLLARTMFCWFVKEKGLIRPELLELSDWDGNKYPLTNDLDDDEFLQSNSYYRGILQNIFYRSLNQKDNRKYEGQRYFHKKLDKEWFNKIPYLNGGIFDELKPEDNAKDSNDDKVIKIPNYLFYGIQQEELITIGKRTKAKAEIKTVEHKGLNGILKSYKFTLDENTPFEEDIALDPEMLGLVFENLLAELDTNLEETNINSIRKLTGSYYTPRKVIYEMVNDSLLIYLSKFVKENYAALKDVSKQLNDLVYYNRIDNSNAALCKAVVHALDQYKMLDPACGSGAFPMGMLHRMVDLLKLVDSKNEWWIELKLKNVDAAQRSEFKKVLSAHLDDYGRKLGIIRDSIYGIDIQPLAVQITKLRFFISLLIDQKIEKGITPMPNIETKIVCADSLKNIKTDLFNDAEIQKLTIARTRYYQPDISIAERLNITNEIVDILDVAFPSFAFQVTKKKNVGQNKALLKDWFTHGTLAAPFFNMDFFFPELKNGGGFDCIIGNPPYGGSKITDEVRMELDIESKDPYGAFIARFLNDHDKLTPLKHGGVLAFIVSDTFMTIKSHLKLRKHLMQNHVHKMLRMHPDTFKATVSTAVMIAERNTKKTINEKHVCLMADLTNISIHEDYEHFVEVLDKTKGIDFNKSKNDLSNNEFAIFHYLQSLINSNNNLPFFIASPKLFLLMKENGTGLKKEFKVVNRRQVGIIKIILNKKEVELIKLGNIAEINQGISTGQNEYYIRKMESSGSYLSVNPNLILNEKELNNLNDNEKQLGIDKVKYSGKHFIPFDKGSESNSGEGWMPNFYVPTEYYIDWSKESVFRMRNLTISERKAEEGLIADIKQDDDKKLAAALRNQDKWFKPTINFSPTGQYSPTFRLGYGTISQNTSSTIVIDSKFQLPTLGILSSRLARYIFKNFRNHTVHTQEGDVIEFSTLLESDFLEEVTKRVETIIENQKKNPRYDYASYEQIEIDRLVYMAYGLNKEDVLEVENWYARRYPKLLNAQRQNLKKLGKSDNYLELYGLK